MSTSHILSYMLGLAVAATGSNENLPLIIYSWEITRGLWTLAHRNLFQGFKSHRNSEFPQHVWFFCNKNMQKKKIITLQFEDDRIGAVRFISTTSSARLPRARRQSDRLPSSGPKPRPDLCPSAPRLRRWRRPTPAACSRRPRRRRRNSSSKTIRWRSAWCGCPAPRSSPTRPRCSASTRATSSSRRTRSPAPTRLPPPPSFTASSILRIPPPPSLGTSRSATASSSATPPTPSRCRGFSSSPSPSGSLPPSRVPIPECSWLLQVQRSLILVCLCGCLGRSIWARPSAATSASTTAQASRPGTSSSRCSVQWNLFSSFDFRNAFKLLDHLYFWQNGLSWVKFCGWW